MGEWAIAEGLVYGMFNNDQNVFSGAVTPRDDCIYHLAVDYGTMNPFAVGLMELSSDGHVRMLRERHYSGRETGQTVDNEEYYRLLVECADGFPITGIVIDPSAAGMKATVNKYGQFRCIDGNNDVLNGIQEVIKYINAGYLKIHDSCEETLKEFQAYSWSDKPTADGKDQVIKENDHHMDLIRYYVYTVARKFNRGLI
jgi:hypothetical protein